MSFADPRRSQKRVVNGLAFCKPFADRVSSVTEHIEVTVGLKVVLHISTCNRVSLNFGGDLPNNAKVST